jgi:hypothetical protein
MDVPFLKFTMNSYTKIFIAIILLLSHVMCANVAFIYGYMLYGIEHKGYSAPASLAFYVALPYLAGMAIVACIIIFIAKKRKSAKKHDSK